MGDDTQLTQSSEHDTVNAVDVFAGLSIAQRTRIFQHTPIRHFHRMKSDHPDLLNNITNNLYATFCEERRKENFDTSEFVSTNIVSIEHLNAYHQKKEKGELVGSFAEYYTQKFNGVEPTNTTASIDMQLKENISVRRAVKQLAVIFSDCDVSTKENSRTHYLERIFSELKKMGLSHLPQTDLVGAINKLVNEQIALKKAAEKIPSIRTTGLVRLYSTGSMHHLMPQTAAAPAPESLAIRVC